MDERADLLLTTAGGATALASTSLATSMPVTATIDEARRQIVQAAQGRSAS